MGKPEGQNRIRATRLGKLRGQRRKLSSRLAKVEKEIARIVPTKEKKAPDAESLNRWLDELSEGLEDLPPLPADFSRADLYDDHN